MRRGLALMVPMLLACAGVLEPKLAARTYRALSIETLDGTITEVRDLGAEGELDTEWLGVTQALDWHPLEPDTNADAHARDLWDGMQRIFASMPDVPAFATTDIAFEPTVVDGLPAVSFETPLGAELIMSTVWACPGSQVMVSLTTAGSPVRTRKAHELALPTVRCGTEPIGVDAAALSWRFVGDPRRWTPMEVPGPAAAKWERDDGEVLLVVESQALLRDPDVPKLCVTTMRKIHDDLAATYTFDATKTTFAEGPGGCTHGWEGVRKDNELLVRGRFEHVGCTDGRAYTLTCLVFGDGDPAHACKGQVECLPG